MSLCPLEPPPRSFSSGPGFVDHFHIVSKPGDATTKSRGNQLSRRGKGRTPNWPVQQKNMAVKLTRVPPVDWCWHRFSSEFYWRGPSQKVADPILYPSLDRNSTRNIQWLLNMYLIFLHIPVVTISYLNNLSMSPKFLWQPNVYAFKHLKSFPNGPAPVLLFQSMVIPREFITCNALSKTISFQAKNLLERGRLICWFAEGQVLLFSYLCWSRQNFPKYIAGIAATVRRWTVNWFSDQKNRVSRNVTDHDRVNEYDHHS